MNKDLTESTSQMDILHVIELSPDKKYFTLEKKGTDKFKNIIYCQSGIDSVLNNLSFENNVDISDWGLEECVEHFNITIREWNGHEFIKIFK